MSRLAEHGMEEQKMRGQLSVVVGRLGSSSVRKEKEHI